MKKFVQKKIQITDTLSEFLLEYGMSKSSLRQLAEGAGMSNRMLLHYFKDKEEIIQSIMIKLTKELILLLDENKKKSHYRDLISNLYIMVPLEHIRKYSRLALELASSTTQGEEYTHQLAKELYGLFYQWIYDCIDEEDKEKRKQQASIVFVILEGLVILDKIELYNEIDFNINLFT